MNEPMLWVVGWLFDLNWTLITTKNPIWRGKYTAAIEELREMREALWAQAPK